MSDKQDFAAGPRSWEDRLGTTLFLDDASDSAAPAPVVPEQQFSASTSSGDTIAGNTSTTRSLAIAGTPSGSGSSSGFINSGADQDWFRIVLRAGETYRFSVDGGTVDPTLALRNAAGTQIAFDDDGGAGTDSRLTFAAQTSGTYFLDVGGFGSDTGSYRVLAQEVQGSTATYARVGMTGRGQGDIGLAGDRDWFAVNLVAGHTYQFQLRGDSSNGGTLGDSFLRLRNGAGTVVTSDDDDGIGLDSFIQFTASSTGRYYLDAGAFGSGTGTYQLTARDFAIDDASAATGTGASLSISGVPSGEGSRASIINNGADQDWYRISLRAGETYEFRADAANDNGTQLDTTLAVRNSSGTLLSFDDDGGSNLNSRILFTAASTGTYFLDVGGFGSSTGGFVVQAREVPADISTYLSLAAGQSFTGDLHAAGDHDWFRVSLTAGTTYSFQLRGASSGGGTVSDPELRLRNSSGTTLRLDDDGGAGLDSLIIFTASSSGTYYLDAGEHLDDATGSYRISMAVASSSSDAFEF